MLASWIVLACLASTSPSRITVDFVADSPKQIADDILESQGKTEPFRFEELAKIRTKAAVQQLTRVCEKLPTSSGTKTFNLPIQRAIEAFEHFKEDPELARSALPYLVECAESDELYRVEAAVKVLITFDAIAQDALLDLVEEASTEDARALATAGLLPFFSEHPTEDNLEKLLFGYRGSGSAKERELKKCLAAFAEDVALPVFDDYLKRDARPAMVAAIFTLVEGYKGEDVDGHLQEWLDSSDAQVQLAALRVLGSRDVSGHLKAVEKLTKSKDPVLRFQALCEVSRLRRDDPAWHKKLEGMARSRDHVQRLAAASGAAMLDADAALGLVRKLSSDSHPAVRSRCYRTLEAMRTPACVELLIECLSVEESNSQYRVLASLQRLTGQSMGPTPAAWERWWTEVGSKEPLPPASQVENAAKERNERRMENLTKGAFFDLPMHSRRAVFVVDNSGSMTSALGPKGKDGSPSRSKRDAVTEQVIQSLKALPDGTLVNLVYFGTEVATWKDTLERLTPDSRAEAIEFARDPGAGGLTALYDALELAFATEDLDTIYLLTDGSPNGGKIDNRAIIQANVSEWNSLVQATIHCVSLGRESELLKALAKDSGGEYRWINE